MYKKLLLKGDFKVFGSGTSDVVEELKNSLRVGGNVDANSANIDIELNPE